MHEKLIKLCSAGLLEELKEYLRTNTNISISQCTDAFQHATYYGHLEILKCLLEYKKNIDISCDNNYNFRIASLNGHLHILKFLLEINKNINISAKNEDAFRSAASNNHIDILKFLLQCKQDIDISAENEQAFEHAVLYGYQSTLKFLLNHNPLTKIQLLNLSIEENIQEIIQIILKYQIINYKTTNLDILSYIPKFYLIHL